MDRRENILRAVRFERPQHIPMHFHINAACWHRYPQDALHDLMATHPLLFPGFTKPAQPVKIEHGGNSKAGQRFVDPWGCAWETAEDGIMGVVVKHPLETWDGFDRYTPPDPEKMSHWGPVDWGQLARNAAQTKDLRSGGIGHNHTWLRLTDIRGYANVLFDMADDEPRLRRLIGMLEDFNAAIVRNFITRVKAEWMGFAEDLGMQVGPQMSPEHFRRFIKPSYQRLMGMARDAGCVVHVHTDGDNRALMDDLLDCGVTRETPGVMNIQDLVNGIDWIRERLTGKVCVELDIDRQKITPFGTPAQVDALVREAVQKLGSREGGLMMIYGLYPGVPLENVNALMDAMEKYAVFYS